MVLLFIPYAAQTLFNLSIPDVVMYWLPDSNGLSNANVDTAYERGCTEYQPNKWLERWYNQSHEVLSTGQIRLMSNAVSHLWMIEIFL
jgi:hypothetical protein